MPYIGGILSENSYKFLTRGTKPFVKRWMRELADKVRALNLPIMVACNVSVHGKFSNERRPDISNLFKVVSDAVAQGLGMDDKFFTVVDNGYETGCLDPVLVISIEERLVER